MTLEIVIRLHEEDTSDIEAVQDRIMDILYEAGLTRVEPISVTDIGNDDSDNCRCGG